MRLLDPKPTIRFSTVVRPLSDASAELYSMRNCMQFTRTRMHCEEHNHVSEFWVVPNCTEMELSSPKCRPAVSYVPTSTHKHGHKLACVIRYSQLRKRFLYSSQILRVIV